MHDLPVFAEGRCCVTRLLVEVESGALFRADTCEGEGEGDGDGDGDGGLGDRCLPLLASHPTELGVQLQVLLSEACLAADEAAGACRRLPPSIELVAGMVVLPSGGEDALAEAGLTAEENLLAHVSETPGVACRMPQADNDFDGIGFGCDLWAHTFDPASVDGEEIPGEGAACFGATVTCE